MKDDTAFLKHILDEVDFILRQSKDLAHDDLAQNEVLRRAIIRSLEIIGEASKNISAAFKERHEELEWRQLTGLRDKLIHHYFGVNLNRVYDVIKNVIPPLKQRIEAILNKK